MQKIKAIISAPVDCYSGYGARARDIVKALIELKDGEWDIKIIAQRWGNTPWGYIQDHEEKWGFLKNYLQIEPLKSQPEIFIMITVPNEFQAVGKYNIGITAGIETTACDPSWVEGVNRIDLTLVSSEHGKHSLTDVVYEKRVNKNIPGVIVKVEKTVEVLFEGVDTDLFRKKEYIKTSNLTSHLNETVKESFAFLYTGMWTGGVIGEDRKNVGFLIKCFLETFKNIPNPPALILKTSLAGSSTVDKYEVIRKIEEVKKMVVGKNLPNIYLLIGDMQDQEMNELYNHPKVKAMVSFTKGEGFGRPLLEFTTTGKPVIASNYSGQLDFLKPDTSRLVKGNLTDIHPSCVVPGILPESTQWFTPDYMDAMNSLKDVYKNYKSYLEKGKRQSYHSRNEFSYEKMKSKLGELLDKYIPEFPKFIPMNFTLPDLTSMQLPTLKKPQNDK